MPDPREIRKESSGDWHRPVTDTTWGQRPIVFDSPRWCDRCQHWGDHHTDRCARPDLAPDGVRDNYTPNGEVRG